MELWSWLELVVTVYLCFLITTIGNATPLPKVGTYQVPSTVFLEPLGWIRNVIPKVYKFYTLFDTDSLIRTPWELLSLDGWVRFLPRV